MDVRELLDPFDRMLESLFPPARVREIERGADFSAEWSELAGSGFLDALVPEEAGGAGLPLFDALPLLMALGRRAVPLPVGETMIARMALGSVAPDGPIALATGAGLVIGGSVAEVVLCGDDGTLTLAEPEAFAKTGVHGSLDTLCAALPVGGSIAAPSPGLRALAATLRAAMISGAADRLLEMTVAYANERVQFGKPIGRQQALQQNLAVMAEDVVAVRMAAQLACRGGWPTSASAAVAKSVASDAAPRIAATAHAVHGAIGISAEFDLQLFTRRLEAWRLADGSAGYWNRLLGKQVLASGCEAIDWVRGELFG